MGANNKIIERLRAEFNDSIVEDDDFRGDLSVVVKKDDIVGIIEYLRDSEGLEFNMLMDICGVDHLGREERFEVVYHLYSVKHKHRIRVKSRVGGDDPAIDSITHLFKSANWFEREAFDMYGIVFKNHPNLRRILTHDEFSGHALRKDYPAAKRQPLSKPTSFA